MARYVFTVSLIMIFLSIFYSVILIISQFNNIKQCVYLLINQFKSMFHNNSEMFISMQTFAIINNYSNHLFCINLLIIKYIILLYIA